MHKSFRALRQDFVDCCRIHSALQPAKHFRAWMSKAPNTGIGNENVARLRDGRPVPADYVTRFVVFSFEAKDDGSQSVRRAIDEYCSRRALLVTKENLGPIVDAISVPVDGVRGDPTMAANDFVESLCKQAASLGLKQIRDCVRPVLGTETDSSDVLHQAIEWMFVDYGRQNSRSKLSYERAKILGEKKVALTLREYQQLALAWTQVERWTVTHAVRDGAPVGVSIALPLSEECYGRLRSGQINSWEVKPSDLRSPSRHLFVEAIAMTPHPGVTGARTPSELLFTAMIAQCARLTRIPGAGETDPLHLLSCGFAPVTVKRLSSFECESTDAVLPDTSFPLLERIIHTAKRPADASIWGNWRTLQLHLA